MLREAASSLGRNTVRRDPVAVFRRLSHQYASSSAPAPQVSSESTAAVDELRQRLASGSILLSHVEQPCTSALFKAVLCREPGHLLC